jgi:hypothetical protein
VVPIFDVNGQTRKQLAIQSMLEWCYGHAPPYNAAKGLFFAIDGSPALSTLGLTRTQKMAVDHQKNRLPAARKASRSSAVGNEK